MVDLDQCTHATINGCDKEQQGWNQGRVSLSPIRRDLGNEESEQRRRVGTGHILHSAAPGCPRLKVAPHLCHFGPGIVWAGGQGQGNICSTSEGLALCPEGLPLRNP
ncbi:hypothetical protein KUCAC02_025475 [Chaenocephalus aceratus]|uniref:Uncharacterized protein n=1 Tax=Chaenocephalus aceratus TaxID=36190 RepID=A0ACB9VU61_CHAAC|nr:hypothetical protein KUCAC02_025475 [Chaenocephalus aceratus]